MQITLKLYPVAGLLSFRFPNRFPAGLLILLPLFRRSFAGAAAEADAAAAALVSAAAAPLVVKRNTLTRSVRQQIGW